MSVTAPIRKLRSNIIHENDSILPARMRIDFIRRTGNAR
jgi:hypothetical protein